MIKVEKSIFYLLLFITFFITWSYSQGFWQGHPAGQSPSSFSYPAYEIFFDLINTQGSGGGFGLGKPHFHLWDIDCWNEKICWCCGFGGVFKSVDGGYHWETIKEPGGWYHVQLTGPEEIWLLEGFHGEAKGRLWHSIDNGHSWEEVLSQQIKGFGQLICKGPVIFVLCNDYPSYISLDHGKTWQKINNIFGSLQASIPGDIQLENGFIIYVLGHKKELPYLVQSKDGGQSWKEIKLPEGLPCPKTLFFATSWMGWIGFDKGKILVTNDGAESWKLCQLPTHKPITALWFDQEGRGFAAVENGNYLKLSDALYRTEDGGKSWKLVLSGAKQFNKLFGFDLKKCWAAGFSPGIPQNDLIGILNTKENKDLP
ncbi:hypothetical protein IT6_09505 [Methylacidiphilum caldifontis]|uniref:WD40/YVTN/BNR-like repeat-containing protein n=1 Tax=Methylacidiphilum caldifontis TaxID=2795386 RepID=UPI001A8E6CED|nr:hypothetical protein [Methylacidiphilum caldifontis]QSR88585.1 hypothetical protein IT6_09505 [Methylacidiphilum caldifontis]